MRLVVLAIFFAVLTPPVRAADLDMPPARLPYEFSPPVHALSNDGDARRHYLAADIDHDGLQEIVISQQTGLLAYDWRHDHFDVCWQYNVPARFQGGGSPLRLGAAVDLDGDGCEEIVLVAHAADTGEWRLWAYDPERNELVVDVSLPVGVDLNGDGRWDGDYEVAAVIPGVRPLAILAREVRFDRRMRGVVAYDLPGGEEVWRYEMGNNVNPGRILPVDLDGDGRLELVIGGSAPDNLDGELVNGTSDDACHLYVLDADGGELWRRRVSGLFSMAYVATADLDGDGTIEILTATSTHAVDRLDRLSVWSGLAGDLLAHRVLPGRARNVVVVPGRDGKACNIDVGCYEGGVHVYTWDGERLTGTVERLAEQGLDFLCALDLLPEPGPELVAGTRAGRLLVMTPALRVLAALPPRSPQASCVHLVHGEGNAALICIEGSSAEIRRLVARPLGWRDRLPVFGVIAALVLLCVWGLLAARRRGERREQDVLASPDDRRRLIRELELSGHGAVAATRSLRRYVWLLESLVQGGENRLQLLIRVGRTGEDLLQEDLPRLSGILELAGATRQDPKLVDLIGDELSTCRRTVERLADRDHVIAAVAEAMPALARAAERVEQGLLNLRQAAESYYRVDICRMIDRILMLRDEEIAGAGIELVVDRETDRMLCRIDPGTLRFVLDNLVGNAISAMQGVATGRLHISARQLSGVVLLRITDTGCGVMPGDYERIFQAGFSSRPGGGMGLFRSRELLRDWGGDLTLERSAPGSGSTFVLRLVALEEESR